MADTYQCMNCGATFKWNATVAKAMLDLGCPNCGGEDFERKESDAA